MTGMMNKGKSMCDSMMSDMGGMDAMMAKGKSMCDDMMGSSNDNSSCSSDASTNSCDTSKRATPKKDDECCSDGSCEL
jgi:hypothetical protein